MTFLAPLFLLGALAVIGPLVFHLIRRTTREVTPFSTLMFLQPSPPRITKRSRLENIVLLLLRCAVVALLALAFARPFFRESSRSPLAPAREGKRQVLLVDTSASMRRGKLWEESRAAVEARVKAAAPADDLAIVLFDTKPRELVSFEEWRKTPPEQRAALAQQRLTATTEGFGGTHLDAALIRAAELLDQPLSTNMPDKREIVLFSDLQEGASLDALQGFGWPERVSVSLAPVREVDAANAGLSWLPETETVSAAGEQNHFRLRVSNSSESKKEQFELRWMAGNTAGPAFAAYVPAGKTRIVRAPKPPASADRVFLTGDAADFDNTVFLLPPQARKVPVLFVGSDADEDPAGLLYYVRRAFPRTSKQEVEITAHRSAERIPTFQLQQAQLLVVADGASETALDGVSQFVREGKIALVPLANPAAAQNVARMLGLESLPASEAAVRDYAMLAQIEFQHPLFAPFADPRFSDFTKIHFWKHRRVDVSGIKDAQVLARFDDGDPALVQAPLEKGNVILLTTTWRPADSQLALSSKFLPLLQALLEQSSQLPPVKAQYFIGEEIPLPPGPGELTVRKPDGSEVSAPTGSRFPATDQPGIYHLGLTGAKVVVNLAPDESRTTPIGVERLIALGVPLAKANTETLHDGERDARTQAVELENQQKLWRWALLACLATALVETAVAARASRRAAANVTPAA